MAREIVTHCDVDMRNDERVPGTTYTLDLGRGPREIDLCDVHAKELLGPLSSALDELGGKPLAPVKASSKATSKRSAAGATGTLDVDVLLAGARYGKVVPPEQRTHPCPFCPLDYTSATSVIAHARKAHGFASKATTTDVFGRVCPLCGQGGFDILATHALHVHELPSVAALFAAAREAGDPHGIVAERVGLAKAVRL